MRHNAAAMNLKVTDPKKICLPFGKTLQYLINRLQGAQDPILLPELVMKSQSLSLPLSPSSLSPSFSL